MSRHTHTKAGANAPCSLSLPRPWQRRRSPKSLFVPQTQRLRPPAPGIQESVPSALGSSCPSFLHLLVSFSRTFPAVPSGSTS
ncbi:FXYD domain-containing ion transport regulator 7 [Rattus norvegicus]|uniref:FXYD domain-containing ion transport regulator 7 n=1 Tax=Rattus norvegicus TaxID=10116 RepID=A6JA48_RAT|nr:FXYD domain-containing ion transport regulator 7 [Rattus norvegicus]